MITRTESAGTANSTRPIDPESDVAPEVSSGAVIDNALIRRFVGGDERAFVEIMERHRRKIFHITFALLRNHADAEEVTQDTFIRVHRGLANFRGGSSFATWLYRIAVNLSHNRYWYYFRRRRQDSFSLDQALSPETPATLADLVADGTPDPAHEAITSEFSAVVERCMQQLDVRHREILALRNSHNRSYDEIAVTLGINTGTVKSRIARARTNLRELLAQACPEFARGAALSEWFLPSHTTHRPSAMAAA